MTESTRVMHTFEPIYNRDSRILILGSFPSVKSREALFYYGHPRNRFWQVLAKLTNRVVPVSIEEKKALLLEEHIAVWDVIASCSITGSADSSIRDVTANDIRSLLEKTGIQAVFANGGKAWELYQKYCFPDTGLESVKLPSTSPANASLDLDALVEKWKNIINIYTLDTKNY